MKNKSAFILIVVLSYFFNGFSQNLPPEISVSGGQIYCPGSSIPIVTSALISDPNSEDTSLPEIYIQIVEGYQIGLDNLALSGVNPNITSSWSTTEGRLTLTGPATFAEFSSAIENVLFQTTQTLFTQDRQVSINLGDANYLPSTGHYYFYVADLGITWTEARDAAASLNYFGLQGYLATITSEDESQLAGEQSTGTGWIGGSDQQNEGTWIWETGPEAGQVFWQGVANGSAQNGMFEFWNTNEPNNFNEEDYAHITDPSIGVLGAWNDLGNTGDPGINNPYHPKGYIVEFGGMPNETVINLSTSSTIIMPRVISSDFTVCGSDSVMLTVEASTVDVSWYETSTSISPIHSGLNYNVNINATTTYWLLPVVQSCATNIVRYPFTVTVNPKPDVNNVTINQCEDAIIDGLSSFNLSAYSDVIVNGSLNNLEVNFFETIDLSIPIDDQSYMNQVNNQIVYAQVLNTVTNCSVTAEVLLVVNTNTSNSGTLTVCDNQDETGLVSFDLTLAESEILNSESADVIVLGYYETHNDALFQENQLNTNYTNTQPYNQTIFARLEQNGSCYSITEVNLKVDVLPNLLDDETVYYCSNTFPETITLYGGVVNDISNNYYYSWSTGETTMTIEVNEAGSYSVEVTKPFGCTAERTIIVLPSNTATFETIEVSDLSENNVVSVIVSGDGEYLYALNDEFGIYQESMIFENVPAGIHSVYVKDIKADCGTVSMAISVLGFPKFFTPNGDTVNDTWQMKGLSSEFTDSMTIEVFNRYGKLVAILNYNNPKWDGTYNGEVLPTDDYWFVARLLDGRTFKGHFTLKR